MCDVVDEKGRASRGEAVLPDSVAQAFTQGFPAGVSRRAFVGGAAMAAGAAAVSVAVPALLDEHASRGAHAQTEASPAPPETHRDPVVGFYMDRPYLDPTGMAAPYVPPAGTRSGQVLAELSESEFLSRHPYG
jgi:hypothetical protein